MDDLVAQAAAAIWPLLSEGVGGAAQEMAARGGSGIYDFLMRRLHRGRQRQKLQISDIQDALHAGLADGELGEDELKKFVNVTQQGLGSVNTVGTVHVQDGKAFVGGVFTAGRDMHIG